jgi:hypothetical protein
MLKYVCIYFFVILRSPLSPLPYGYSMKNSASGTLSKSMQKQHLQDLRKKNCLVHFANLFYLLGLAKSIFTQHLKLVKMCTP